MKKILALLLALVLVVSSAAVFAAEWTVTVTYSGSNITAAGTLPTGRAQDISLIAYEKEGGKDNLAKVAAVVEGKSNADGSFTISFGMDDERFGGEKDADGYPVATLFVLEVSSREDGVASAEFSYLNAEARETALDGIKEIETAEELSTFLDNESIRQQLTIAGVNYDAYDALSEAEKSEAAAIAATDFDFSGVSEEEFVSRINTAIAIEQLAAGDKTAEEVLTMIDPVYGDLSYSEITDEALLEEIHEQMTGAEVGSVEEFLEIYEETYGLSTINNARTGGIESALADAAEALGFADDERYKDYKDLTRKSAVNDALVLALNSNPASSVEELLDTLEDCVADASSGSSSGGGSGSGGSGGSGGGSGGNRITASAGIAAPAVSGSFSDLNQAAWAKDYIEALSKKGIVSGYPDGSFRPNGTVTRAEFTKIVLAAMGRSGMAGDGGFADAVGHWAQSWIAEGAQLGIIKGVDETHFDPDAPILRQDMAVILGRAVSVSGITLATNKGTAIADMDTVADYAKASVQQLVDGGVISGDQNADFNPYNYLTRAETAKVVYYLFP